MRCPTCNTQNPGPAKFCLNCGRRLVRTCPECGTGLPPEARFCFSCGAQLDLPPPETGQKPASHVLNKAIERLVPKEFAERLLATRGQVKAERRMVTILMSDVKGSSAMARGVDPEEVMEVMDGAFEVLIRPIARYEGTVARLEGDAILAFFGAPIAHEDDPERACRAGLEIVEGARAYAARLEEERGIRGFSVGVGIHTGLVVVGEVGTDLRVEYTAMGEAPNLAARLESAAEPGTVLISEEAHQLIAPLFETEALEPIEVRGWEQPVSVYRVLEARELPGKVRGIAGLESPLVGRGVEFAALREAVERLRVGVGGIVTIVGDAGIGKSRLVAELRKEILAKASQPSQGLRHVQWLEGRCLSYGTSIAYLLWLDVLRGLLGVTPEATPAQVLDALQARAMALCPESFDAAYPYLARLMSLPLEDGLAARLDDSHSQDLKTSTFRAIETLVVGVASECPLVLVCEDLHWADPSSIELLERLLSLTDRTGLLLICVFRPRRESRCWRVREVAARDYPHRHTDVLLGPLSSDQSLALVCNLLRIRSMPAQFRHRILSVAEGNPFYMEEILRGLVDRGAVIADETTGVWRIAEGAVDIELPTTLQGALLARIDRLQEDTKRVLQMASVIGRIFLYRILAAIAREERDLDEHLITLQRQQMIRERARIPEVEYIFKHELTREAAYNGLLNRERRAFHRGVAQALEQLFPDRVEEQLGLLAHHWERAGDAEKAIAYLLRAGDQARMVYAHEEAIDYYQRALRFLRERGEHEQAARTLMKLGLVHTAAFQSHKAREAYDEGFSLWRGWQTEELSELRKPVGVLRLAVEEPPTLDPGLAGDDISMFITGQLFEGLVQVDPDYNVLPAVAARWELAEQGTRYIFHLREGLHWSDGTLVTAPDFEYAWKRNLDPATDSPVAHLLYVIDNARAFREGKIGDRERVGVKAADDRTLEVRLEAPTAYFPHLMAHPVAYPLPSWAMEPLGVLGDEPEGLVSNGPYRLAVWERGERLVLEKNARYRGPFPGNAHRVECRIFSDYASVLSMYADDELDIVSMIQAGPGTIARVQAAHGGEMRFTPQLSTLHLAFLVGREPFGDPRVRQAFVHAVDRERLVRDAWGGQYQPANGGFVPPGMPGHSSDIGLSYDPDRARRLLAEAGYPGGEGFPRVRWIYSGSSRREPLIPFLQRAWHDTLGLQVDAVYVGWQELAEPPDAVGLVLCGWRADYPDPDHMLRATFHSTEGLNMPGWRNARFDALVEEAARVADQSRRVELYREADRILVAEEAVVMPIGYARGRILAKPWVTAPRVPPALLRLKDVECSPERRGHSEEV